MIRRKNAALDHTCGAGSGKQWCDGNPYMSSVHDASPMIEGGSNVVVRDSLVTVGFIYAWGESYGVCFGPPWNDVNRTLIEVLEVG